MSKDLQTVTDTGMQLLTTYGMSVVAAIIILILGWLASRIVYRSILSVTLKSEKIDDTIGRFFAAAARYAILLFTVIAVLSKFGIQTASIIAVLGALGLAIGFALQGTLANVASGLLILFLRPFKIGDYIEAGNAAGTVRSVSLFTTELNTPDNVVTVVPNGSIISGTIKNYSDNPERRVDLLMGIAYEDDINKAFEVIHTAIGADSRILQEPAPMTAVGELADSSVNLIVRVWCKREDYWPVKFDLTKALKEAFDQNGISIPFPQRVLHHAEKTAAE